MDTLHKGWTLPAIMYSLTQEHSFGTSTSKVAGTICYDSLPYSGVLHPVPQLVKGRPRALFAMMFSCTQEHCTLSPSPQVLISVLREISMFSQPQYWHKLPVETEKRALHWRDGACCDAECCIVMLRERDGICCHWGVRSETPCGDRDHGLTVCQSWQHLKTFLGKLQLWQDVVYLGVPWYGAEIIEVWQGFCSI